MRYAITALMLTVAYVALMVANPPAAAGAGGFYLAAVTILVIVQRATERGNQ